MSDFSGKRKRQKPMMDDNIEDSSSSANNDSDEHISTSPVDGGEDQQKRQVDSVVEEQKMRLESTLDVGDGTEHGGKRFKPSSDSTTSASNSGIGNSMMENSGGNANTALLINKLVAQMDAMSKEISELRSQEKAKLESMEHQVKSLQEENTALRKQQQEMESLKRQYLHQEKLLAEFKHKEEHDKAKIELVDNSKESLWDTSNSKLTVTGCTIKQECPGFCSIRSTRGFPTVPTNDSNNADLDLLIHHIHYYEVTIDEMPSEWIIVGLVAKDYPMGEDVGGFEQVFGIGISHEGKVWHSDKEKAAFGCVFGKGDVVGCGIRLTQKTKSAEAVNCAECLQKQCALFFTKNGELLGTAVPLPLADVPFPAMLYPAITLYQSGDKVTANLGQQPFKYAIPPAKDLIC